MKRKISFEVDNMELFDRLKQSPAFPQALGSRLIEYLLAEPSQSTLIGLEFYGVSYVIPNTGGSIS